MLRDVNIRLLLNAAPFIAGARAAQAASTRLAGDIARDASRGSRSVGLLQSSFGTVGLVAGAAGVVAVKAAADFDQSMSSVKATGADAAANMGKLRQAALDAGNATKFSATEAAGGIEALAKAGVASRDILGGGLAGALDLAAAGNLDVAGSAEAAAAAMSQFSLTGRDVPHIADLLAAGAGKANGEVSDMAAALNQVGLVANGAGASIEETTGTLAAFAQAGLIGSDAGTSMKTMLQRLQAPTGVAAAEMKRLGISAYDSKGNFVGMASIAGQLTQAFKGQSDEARSAALATIFGADAVRAANVLYQNGESGIRNWTNAVNDSGYAAEVAQTKMDNLKGDLETLKGTLETVFVQGGEGAQGPLRDATQMLNDFVVAGQKAGDAWDGLLKKLHIDPEGGIQTRRNDLVGRAQGLFAIRGASKASGVSQKIVSKFEVLGADAAASKALKVARAAKLTPKEVRTILTSLGWKSDKIDRVTRALRSAQQRSNVKTKLAQVGWDAGKIEKVGKALDGARSKKDIKVRLQKAGFDSKDIATVLSLIGKVDKQRAKPSAKLNDQASSKLLGIIGYHNKLNGKSTSSTHTVTTVKRTEVKPAGGGAIERGSLFGFADGGYWGPRAAGAMSGAGDGTVDTIPAMLANGEHVLTASDVRKAGGQDAIFRLRAGIQAGAFQFATGGPVRMWSPVSGYAAGGSVSGAAGSSTFTARLADNRVHVKGGLLELIDDRVLVTIGAAGDHARQAQMRRRDR